MKWTYEALGWFISAVKCKEYNLKWIGFTVVQVLIFWTSCCPDICIFSKLYFAYIQTFLWTESNSSRQAILAEIQIVKRQTTLKSTKFFHVDTSQHCWNYNLLFFHFLFTNLCSISRWLLLACRERLRRDGTFMEGRLIKRYFVFTALSDIFLSYLSIMLGSMNLFSQEQELKWPNLKKKTKKKDLTIRTWVGKCSWILVGFTLLAQTLGISWTNASVPAFSLYISMETNSDCSNYNNSWLKLQWLLIHLKIPRAIFQCQIA